MRKATIYQLFLDLRYFQTKLENQKIELIFEQVKKEVKNKNINVSSTAILPLLEVLRKNDNKPDSEEESITSAAVFFQNEITPTKESNL